VIALDNPANNHKIHYLPCALALENPDDDYKITLCLIDLENPAGNQSTHSLLYSVALEIPAEDYNINMYAEKLPLRIQPTTMKCHKPM
jgi:hypothetical protein